MRWISWRLRTWPITMLIVRTVAKRRMSRGLSCSDQHRTGCGSTQIKQVRLEIGDDAGSSIPRHPVLYPKANLEENQGKFAAILLGKGVIFAEGLKDTQSHFPDFIIAVVLILP